MKESKALISPFFRTVKHMVKNYLPCPWDINIKLYSTTMHRHIIQILLYGIIFLVNKSTIPTNNEVVNQLKPLIETIVLLTNLIKFLGEVDYNPMNWTNHSIF